MRKRQGMRVRAPDLLLFCARVLLTAGAVQEKKISMEDLDWLAGSWQTAPDGRTQVEEHWTAAAGRTMIGMGRTVAGGKTVFFEYLRIDERPEGVFYVAHPKARPGTDFKLVKLDREAVVFKNPQHDFPQRVIYRKKDDGALFARVEGLRNGQTVGEDFNYLPMKK